MHEHIPADLGYGLLLPVWGVIPQSVVALVLTAADPVPPTSRQKASPAFYSLETSLHSSFSTPTPKPASAASYFSTPPDFSPI